MLDQVKAHVKRHQTTYCIIVVAGITCIIMRGRYAGIQRVPDRSIVGNAALDLNIRPFSFFLKQTVNVISVVEREGRGHPGYLVRCLETNDIFRTQGEAARSLGVDGSIMSKHMLGYLPNVNGFHFERLSGKI